MVCVASGQKSWSLSTQKGPTSNAIKSWDISVFVTHKMGGTKSDAIKAYVYQQGEFHIVTIRFADAQTANAPSSTRTTRPLDIQKHQTKY